MSERRIDVCSACLKATCWYGLFMCDEARTADVIKMPVSRLQELNREHPDYWTDEAVAQYVTGVPRQ